MNWLQITGEKNIGTQPTFGMFDKEIENGLNWKIDEKKKREKEKKEDAGKQNR